jgi:hypothetical protein
LDQVNNTSDANKPLSAASQTALATKANASDVTASLATKVDKVSGKDLSTNDYSTAEKTKLAAITGTNTGDQDLSALATNTALALKANTADVTTALNLKANTTDITTSLATKVDKVTGKELSTNDYTTAEKTKLAAITGTNTGDQVNITGNAGTATKLQNSVTINGIAFDGSANSTVPAGVPYTGATQAVNLGAYDLAVNGITVGKGGGNYASNTAFGNSALSVNTTGGINNTAIGSGSLSSNTSGGSNTAIGKGSLNTNSTGSSITAIGMNALENNTTGSNNTAIGGGALSTNSTGGSNTAIGHGANVGSNNLTNATAIGSGAIVAADNTIQLGNTAVTKVNTSGTITAAGMGLGVSAPNASAILEASSTTQGFLPPRLTTTERDAIATPAAGLTIWNSTNTQLEVYDGSYWKNMVGLLVSPLQVGDEYGGGKVFYIFGPSDNGYIKGQTHGLIAATEDQTTDAGVKWFPGKFYGATGTYIGLGLPNTLGIITSAIVLGTTNMSSFAAGLANSYRGGGYIDWFLPSRDELNLLYQAKDDIGGFATNQTPGVSPAYWSSTQKGGITLTNFTSFVEGVTNARVQFLNTGGSPVQQAGTITDTDIGNLRRVRAIRIF